MIGANQGKAPHNEISDTVFASMTCVRIVPF
jgi:hypothetical protein